MKTLVVPPEDVELMDTSNYKEELTQYFGQVPEVAKPLLQKAKSSLARIEEALYTAPAFINAVKSVIPDVVLQAADCKRCLEIDDQKRRDPLGNSYQPKNWENCCENSS